MSDSVADEADTLAASSPVHAASVPEKTKLKTWDGVSLAAAADADSPAADDAEEEEKLLEELLRLKLTSSTPEATATSLLAPKQRSIKLFQPPTKMEQFEDILLESQLLDSSLALSSIDLGGSGANYGSGGLLDFDATDAIFLDKESSKAACDNPPEAEEPEKEDPESPCSCAACRNRSQMEEEKTKEVERLRGAWIEVREQIRKVYDLVVRDRWNEESEERPDLAAVKLKVGELCGKDPHQLYQRLEAGVREFVLEMKLRLIELLQKQAKDPSLAEDFIQTLLDGYEKICSAAQYSSPALVDLEEKHLTRFTLTWEIFNKHLYQSIIYTDPLIQNNLPIFISQLRSLYPDKEHEAKYTHLVRGYLDFDVEMEQINAFWRHSEAQINDFNNQQIDLRKKQKMFREDLEKFKRERLKQNEDKCDESCECDACQSSRVCKNQDPLLNPSFVELVNTITANITGNHGEGSGDAGKLYPHLYQSILQGSSPSLLKENAKQGLAALFPSLLTAEGLKPGSESSVATSTPTVTTSSTPLTTPTSTTTARRKSSITAKSESSVVSTTSSSSSSSSGKKVAAFSSSSQSKLPPGKCDSHKNHLTGSKEINQLLHEHYCGKKAPPKPSAVKRGKLPAPPSTSSSEASEDPQGVRRSKKNHPVDCESCTTEELSHDEDLEYDDDLDDDDDDSDSNVTTSAEASGCCPPSGHHHHGEAAGGGGKCSCCYCEVFGHGGGGQTNAPVSRNYPEMRERLRLILKKKKKNKSSIAPSSSTSAVVEPKAAKVQKSQSLVAIKPKDVDLPEEPMDVDDLLDFIEGNQKSTNEKKRAKKERQKQQRLEEIRRHEEEERRKREAEEREKKLREEEEQQRKEAERQMVKKRNKKQAQKIKKLQAKGLPIPPELLNEETSDVSAETANPSSTLEQLKAKQMKELLELQMLHNHQLEEQKKMLEQQILKQQQQLQQGLQKKGKKDKKASSARSSATKTLAEAAKNPGSQIKITRTPNGGVEFTTVPAGSEVPAKSMFSKGLVIQPPPQGLQGPHGLQGPQAPYLRDRIPPHLPNGSGELRPSVPSKSNQPMVTIRRIDNPSGGQPTVTISMMEEAAKAKKDKLLYTLVNGEVIKSKDAPQNLLPNAKPMPEGFNPAAVPRQPRPPLPLDEQGKVDLNRLELPSGVSITKISGPVPERKYFPSKPNSVDQTTLPLPGQHPLQSQFWNGQLPERQQGITSQDYLKMAGLDPNQANNVIVVDTSSLSTKEDEDKKADDKPKSKNSRKRERQKKQRQEKQQAVVPTPPQPTPQEPPKAKDLKSGPQVLIKNVNGKVVITPIPGAGVTDANLKPKVPPQKKQLQPKTVNSNNNNNNRTAPKPDKINGNSEEKKVVNGSSNNDINKRNMVHNMDEINSIFEPKDIDLDNGDIDDDEREIEAFKRFCFNSVPLQQKPKISIDMKNISLKKK